MTEIVRSKSLNKAIEDHIALGDMSMTLHRLIKALEENEKLRQRVAELEVVLAAEREKHRWIPVEEKLPGWGEPACRE